MPDGRAFRKEGRPPFAEDGVQMGEESCEEEGARHISALPPSITAITVPTTAVLLATKRELTAQRTPARIFVMKKLVGILWEVLCGVQEVLCPHWAHLLDGRGS